MNILFLSRWFPFPPNNGSKIRIHQLLHGLSQSHDITLLSFSDLPLPLSESLQQNNVCSRIQVVPWKPYNSQSVKARLGFFSNQPRFLVDTYSLEMDSLIRATIQNYKFDLVIASQLSMASYFPSFQGIPALFEEMELGTFYGQVLGEGHFSERLLARLRWLKLKRYISRLLKNFNSSTVVSEKEYQIIARNFQGHEGKVDVLPNGVDFREYQNVNVDRRPKHLIFSGSFTFPANYLAMQWFIGRVFPLVLEKIPEAQLIITGDHADLPLPSMKNVILTGYVEDIKSWIASCDVSIAPIWSGGGTRLKILEAMAVGTPVVATSKGAEGLLAQSGTHLLIEDDPQKFAECVIQLLTNSGLREKLSYNAAQFVKEKYDWQIIMPQFLRLVEKIASGSLDSEHD
jgi:polysaccharide biosynthesis protein PslH